METFNVVGGEQIEQKVLFFGQVVVQLFVYIVYR